MLTISHPPTPVKAADPGATIDIHEKMLSPHAESGQALQLVELLQSRGWPARYQPMNPRWHFTHYSQAARFRVDFEELLTSISAPFVWPVYIDEEADESTPPDLVATVVFVDDEIPQLATGGVLP